MTEGPDPKLFATISYYLGFASALILVVTYLLGLLTPGRQSPVGQIVWLALITSAVGVVLAWMARVEFQRMGTATPDDERHYKLGLRVNVMVLAFMTLLVIFVAIISLSPNIGT